ncbi:unnamed protein product [Allacma fusca]|uniref:Uncharacterized protein n=1 Tax=Allacma fusca TaxID=39272 RepID=A0A8J2JY02_9HEXA|nr:unnamed protein product [Allacma fusca]
MDFCKKKATARLFAGFDLGLTTVVVTIASYKIVEAVLMRLSPEPDTMAISSYTMAKHMALWFGFFALHVLPLCTAFALFRVTGKGREEMVQMITKCRSWLKSTLYLLIALVIMFILFSLDSDVQSFIGSGLCVSEIFIRLVSRCFVQTFYESLNSF